MVSVNTEQEEALLNHLREQNIIFTKQCQTVGSNVIVDEQDYGVVQKLKSTNDDTFGQLIEK